MPNGYSDGKTEEHRHTTQDRLRKHYHHGRNPQRANPTAGLESPKQESQANREKGDCTGNDAVAVLENYAADHFGKKRAVAERPVGNRESRAGASDQRAG